MNELNIQIVNITDFSGRIIVRANNTTFGDDVASDPYMRYVIGRKAPCSGTGIVDRGYLLRESGELADRARIGFVETPMAASVSREFEDKAMVLKAAAPVFYQGKPVGIIYGEKVLNNSFELVDRIKKIVFRDGLIGGYDIGTVTIFMDGVRVSTNVKRRNGERAVGTLVSKDVYREVINGRNVWLDKAFVVNNWYISGYSPIIDIDNRVVGILYVGIIEEKYNIIKRNAVIYSVLLTGATALLALLLSVYLIRGIIVPINTLVTASIDIAQGKYDKKIEIVSRDEIGYLCKTFNKMIDAICERDEMLMEQTERKIVQSEKLASLGRLASGIAHEINNPLTGVLCFGTALRDDLKGSPYEEDLNVIVNETLRCREIVRGILDFARETAIEKTTADINGIITDTIAILKNHVNFHNIKVTVDLGDGVPLVDLDVNQIKSVINNLAVNAADAMKDGGELTVSTEFNPDNRQIMIAVADTGTGIKKEIIEKIFDPFFTTKKTGEGTGLGLAVTYGIVRRHNGNITVESEEGKGTVFRICLPV